MHEWGDGFPYFKEVAEASEEMGDFCAKWGRIAVTQTKEKYGTCRVYCSFGWYQLGQVFFPRYHWCKGPKILWKIYIPKWINKIFIPYQIWIYRLAYKKAIKKYPMIKKEILCGADWSEYLGGL